MVNKKHSDIKQFFLGAAITLFVWVLGIYISGYFPWLLEPVKVSDGCTFLSKLFPFMLVIYSVVTASVSKIKAKRKLFFGAYLFLLIPSVAFLFLWINQYLGLDLENYISFVLLLVLIPAMPVLSSFDGFFKAFYGNIRPAGFSEAHIIFCIVLVVACALPPIIYKLVKSKQISE